jgi:hypothetical protein
MPRSAAQTPIRACVWFGVATVIASHSRLSSSSRTSRNGRGVSPAFWHAATCLASTSLSTSHSAVMRAPATLRIPAT